MSKTIPGKLPTLLGCKVAEAYSDGEGIRFLASAGLSELEQGL